MRVFKWIVGILLGLILVIVLGAYAYLKATLPDYDGEITVPGLAKPVDIIRDSYGMPHIYAQTDSVALMRDVKSSMLPPRLQGNAGLPHL
jgi:penicillin amidase